MGPDAVGKVVQVFDQHPHCPQVVHRWDEDSNLSGVVFATLLVGECWLVVLVLSFWYLQHVDWGSRRASGT